MTTPAKTRPSRYPYAWFQSNRLQSAHTSIWAAKTEAHKYGVADPDIRIWEPTVRQYLKPADHPAYGVKVSS